MGQADGSERVPWAIPPAAEEAWLELQAGLVECGPVPCQESDVEAWWPDKRDLDAPATQRAIAACRQCPVEGPCAEYALAADERFGLWGGTLPDERRRARA